MQDTEIPETMKSGTDLQASRGTCGFKMQIVNANKIVKYSFTLLRDSGIALTASAAAAVIAFALFWSLYKYTLKQFFIKYKVIFITGG